MNSTMVRPKIKTDREYFIESLYSFSGYDANGYRTENIKEIVYVSTQNTEYSDYSGSLVSKGNVLDLIEYCDKNRIKYIHNTGHYGHNEIALSIRSPRVRGILNGLDNYPLFDDQSYSDRCCDWVKEAWLNHGYSEFINAFSEYLIAYPKLSRSKAYKLWQLLNESADVWIDEHTVIYFPLDTAYKRTTIGSFDGCISQVISVNSCPLLCELKTDPNVVQLGFSF
jgi:hypothetical protein